MLMKEFDQNTEALSTLEALRMQATGHKRKLIEDEISYIRAGMEAEKESAYFINFDLEKSQNWVVIHDLRLEVAGRVAQIDHVLINRLLEVFVLESKSVHAGIKITEDGEFLRFVRRNNNYEGMPSPLSQNERHVAVLADAMRTIELPVRLGMRLSPTFEPYVLISPKARIDRPKNFDTSRVVKSDDFMKRMRRKTDEMGAGEVSRAVTRVISQETLESIGRQLVAFHRPVSIDYRAKFGLSEASTDPAPYAHERRATGPNETETHVCRQCQSERVSIVYGKYGYYFKCADCDGNTPIRISCGRAGHKERLRKEGQRFFRECAECKSSRLFFTNGRTNTS